MSATASTTVDVTHGIGLEWNTADPVEVWRL